jgi:hypothetical protein
MHTSRTVPLRSVLGAARSSHDLLTGAGRQRGVTNRGEWSGRVIPVLAAKRPAEGGTRCWAVLVATRFSNGSQEVCIMAGVSKTMMRALLVCISDATFVTTVAGNNRRVLRRIQVYR